MISQIEENKEKKRACLPKSNGELKENWFINFFSQERAEWINSILQQLWPNVGHYTRKIIAETVEPAVKAALDGYGLAGFKFEKVVLGQIPPRVTGIKVYDKNVGRDEIILDLVSFSQRTTFALQSCSDVIFLLRSNYLSHFTIRCF